MGRNLPSLRKLGYAVPIPVTGGLRYRSAVAGFLGLQVRIPLGTWMFMSCVYVWRPLRRADQSSRGVLPGVYVCLIVCGLESSTVIRPRPELGFRVIESSKVVGVC
jgi:hypothetical protein